MKRENLKRETCGPVARQDWWKSCASQVPDACMSTLVGFMVGVRVVFGVVVSLLFRACIPVITKLVLGSMAIKPPEEHIHHFGPARNNCFIGNTCGG